MRCCQDLTVMLLCCSLLVAKLGVQLPVTLRDPYNLCNPRVWKLNNKRAKKTEVIALKGGSHKL